MSRAYCTKSLVDDPYMRAWFHQWEWTVPQCRNRAKWFARIRGVPFRSCDQHRAALLFTLKRRLYVGVSLLERSPLENRRGRRAHPRWWWDGTRVERAAAKRARRRQPPREPPPTETTIRTTRYSRGRF